MSFRPPLPRPRTSSKVTKTTAARKPPASAKKPPAKPAGSGQACAK
jgi:hypothetical protein